MRHLTQNTLVTQNMATKNMATLNTVTRNMGTPRILVTPHILHIHHILTQAIAILLTPTQATAILRIHPILTQVILHTLVTPHIHHILTQATAILRTRLTHIQAILYIQVTQFTHPTLTHPILSTTHSRIPGIQV